MNWNKLCCVKFPGIRKNNVPFFTLMYGSRYMDSLCLIRLNMEEASILKMVYLEGVELMKVR